jgi:hypothetical protein
VPLAQEAGIPRTARLDESRFLSQGAQQLAHLTGGELIAVFALEMLGNPLAGKRLTQSVRDGLGGDQVNHDAGKAAAKDVSRIRAA